MQVAGAVIMAVVDPVVGHLTQRQARTRALCNGPLLVGPHTLLAAAATAGGSSSSTEGSSTEGSSSDSESSSSVFDKQQYDASNSLDRVGMLRRLLAQHQATTNTSSSTASFPPGPDSSYYLAAFLQAYTNPNEAVYYEGPYTSPITRVMDEMAANASSGAAMPAADITR